jgi:hypothetical protein
MDILPLPAGMRDLLLQILALGYPAGYAQTRLSNAPDAAIAWQVQSCLDDYADHAARQAFTVPRSDTLACRQPNEEVTA